MSEGQHADREYDGCVGCRWEQARSLSEAAELIAAWLRHELPDYPGYAGPPAAETALITEPLLTLTACGIVPVGSQPGLGTTSAPIPAAGAGDGDHAGTDATDAPPGVFVPPTQTVQRAYLDLIGPKPLLAAIATALTGPEVRWHQGPTRWRAQRAPYTVDMVVTAWARSQPADPADPYFQEALAHYLDPQPTRYFPPGSDPYDGSLVYADMDGLDPRAWQAATRCSSGWGLGDVMADLVLDFARLNRPLRDREVLASPDLVCALNGSESLTLVDTRWGREGWLVQAAAEAATGWHLRRAAAMR